MPKAVIVSYARTAIGRAKKGSLKDTRPEEFAAPVLQALLKRTPGLEASMVDDVMLGCAMPEAEQGMNVARMIALLAGFPVEVPATTLNRFCSSGSQSIAWAADVIRSGNADVIVAGGVESMSMVPMGGNKIIADPPLVDAMPNAYASMGTTAEVVARQFGIGREEQDAWALRSQRMYARALAEGIPAEEIVPVTLPGGKVFEADELPRPETTMEALGKLPTIYGSPTVTAGNAPGLDAGAAALVVMSAAEARRRGVRPLARLLSYAAVALAPRRMAEAPAEAAGCALKRAGLSLASLDRVEINEAFAAVPLVSTKSLSGDDTAALAALRERTNGDGGAIAIGHPVGASGARIVGTLAMALRRRGGGRGLAAICGGLAQGDAAVLEAAG